MITTKSPKDLNRLETPETGSILPAINAELAERAELSGKWGVLDSVQLQPEAAIRGNMGA